MRYVLRTDAFQEETYAKGGDPEAIGLAITQLWIASETLPSATPTEREFGGLALPSASRIPPRTTLLLSAKPLDLRRKPSTAYSLRIVLTSFEV